MMPRDEGETKSETATGWIAFDRVEIDLAGRRLFVGGVETPLEPKAFDVLALLARNPGQAFTRDGILDAVWGHRHVTPGVLNRVITLLRQALGESAQRTQYLHTLHGVGYRFDAPVRFVAERPRADGGVPAMGAAAPIRTVRNEADVDAHFAPADAASGTHAGPRRPMLSPFRSAWTGLAGLAIIVGAGVFWLRHASTPAALPRPAPVLVVLPLHPVGQAADETILAEGLSEELITRLSHIEGLRLISSTSSALAQSARLDLNQLAGKLKVTHAIEGSLRKADQQLRIDLRLVEVPAGRTLWAQTYDRNLANVLALESEIAQAVARSLALRLGLAAGAATRDTDPELFREYLEARRVARGADRTRGIAMMRAIIAKSPDYARAHASLARLLASNLRYWGVAAGEIEEAGREAARALELDPDLAETQTALATLACRRADWARCVELFRHSLALDPTDSDCRTTYASWLVGMGYLDEALDEAEIGSTSDPLSGTADFVHARVLDTLGRHDEAARYVAKGGTAYAKWFNATWRRDFAAARSLAAAMPEDEGFREVYVAATEALVDPSRWPEVVPLIDASERASGRFNVLRIDLPNADVAEVVSGLEKMLRDGWPSYYMLMWMPEYAALRRDRAFQDFLQRTHIIDYWRSNGWPAQCHADGERAVCG